MRNGNGQKSVMERRHFLRLGLAAGLSWAGLSEASTAGVLSEAPDAGSPSPRYPRVPSLIAVGDLLPNARHIIRRKHLNSRPGYTISGGERVLFFADDYTDLMVLEAFQTAFHERECAVDFVLLNAPRKVWDSADVLELVVRKSRENQVRLWNMQAPYLTDLLQGYDRVIAPDYLPASHVMQGAYGRRHRPMVWPTRELLADASVIPYPEDVLKLAEQKTWNLILQIDTVRVTDAEGTDLKCTYGEEYWKVLEGTHPTYKIPGAGPGKSRIPLEDGHLMGIPRFALPQNDAAGIVAGTVDHIGPYPRLEMEVKGGRAVRLRGGARFGDLWREYIEKTKAIHYPHQKAPGCDFLMEGAIGTHPKIKRPHNVLKSPAARSAWHYDRRRAGVFHFGFGQADDSE